MKCSSLLMHNLGFSTSILEVDTKPLRMKLWEMIQFEEVYPIFNGRELCLQPVIVCVGWFSPHTPAKPRLMEVLGNLASAVYFYKT